MSQNNVPSATALAFGIIPPPLRYLFFRRRLGEVCDGLALSFVLPTSRVELPDFRRCSLRSIAG